MKKRWKIIAGILCITLMGTACSKKTINDGEEQQTTLEYAIGRSTSSLL